MEDFDDLGPFPESGDTFDLQANSFQGRTNAPPSVRFVHRAELQLDAGLDRCVGYEPEADSPG